MDFKDVQNFFKSWGMFPSDEDCNEGSSENDWLNPDVINEGINRKCYEKLCNEANDQSGANFSAFCSAQINATDDSFYLRARTWAELEEAWKAYSEQD